MERVMRAMRLDVLYGLREQLEQPPSKAVVA